MEWVVRPIKAESVATHSPEMSWTSPPALIAANLTGPPMCIASAEEWLADGSKSKRTCSRCTHELQE